MRHLCAAYAVRAEIARLRIAIGHELRSKARDSERLRALQARKARLTDELVALEIKAFAASSC